MKQKIDYNKQSQKVWGHNPAGWTHASNISTDQQLFFETVLQKRFESECQWTEWVVDYKQYAYKKVLEIGSGAGFDAYQFLQVGADYTGIDITPQNIERSTRYLSYYGFKPRILQMNAENLDFGQEKFDFIFSLGVVHCIPNIKKVLINIKNHLADTGTAQLIVYHKTSIFYWVYLYCYSWLYLGDRKRYKNFTERLEEIEVTGTDQRTLVRVYTKREFEDLLKSVGFVIKKTEIAKLETHDFPTFLGKLYNKMPIKVKRFLEKNFGWYLCVTVGKA